jgi:hypothetical protein
MPLEARVFNVSSGIVDGIYVLRPDWPRSLRRHLCGRHATHRTFLASGIVADILGIYTMGVNVQSFFNFPTIFKRYNPPIDISKVPGVLKNARWQNYLYFTSALCRGTYTRLLADEALATKTLSFFGFNFIQYYSILVQTSFCHYWFSTCCHVPFWAKGE